VTLTVYRTADYAIAARQSVPTTAQAATAHLWQATLGLDAVVFTNHPATSSLLDAEQPNFWRGNAGVPHIGQWQDVVMVLYGGAETGGYVPQLDFTHAYFPLATFDEHLLRERWAFARRGSGYLALTAVNGIELVTSGRAAYRELRSPGVVNGWLCQMGRAADDGNFTAFVERVLAPAPTLNSTQIRYTSLRGEVLELAWGAPILVNGQPYRPDPTQHICSPYGSMVRGATHLDVQFQDNLMRLDFSSATPEGVV
jgi:hypothetical protein